MTQLRSDSVTCVDNVLQGLQAQIRKFHVIPNCVASERSCPTRHFLNDTGSRATAWGPKYGATSDDQDSPAHANQ